MVLGILFPLASLIASSRTFRELPPGLRVSLSLCVALLLAAPGFRLRQVMPVPPLAADLLLILFCAAPSLATGAFRRWIADLRSEEIRAAWPWLAVAIPALFVLTWMGFGVVAGDNIRFYGLFPVDFCNLTSVTALLDQAHGRPLAAVDGAGPLQYHWYFFALPAWMGGFLSLRSPLTHTLILSNWLAACVLFLTLCETARAWMARPRPAVAALIAAVVVFAPLSTYAYQFLIAVLRQPWFTTGQRNHLLLSIVNSMAVFGNNTLALAMALLVLLLVKHWNTSLRRLYLVVIPGLAFLLPAYSATLAIPLWIALGGWLLAGQIRKPAHVTGCALAIGAACALVLVQTGVLASGERQVAVLFDRGQYLQNLLFGLAPLLVLAAASLGRGRQIALYWLGIVACVAVPSFLYMRGSYTGQADFSMKTASLIIVLLTPMVAAGIERLEELWFERRLLAICIAAPLLLGLVNTATYAGQFPILRLSGSASRTYPLPLDYHRCLLYVRDHTPRGTIVINTRSMEHSIVNWTVAIAQRRVYLPSTYDMAEGHGVHALPGMRERRDRWQTWEADASPAALPLMESDAAGRRVLIARKDLTFLPKLFSAGDYGVYQVP